MSAPPMKDDWATLDSVPYEAIAQLWHDLLLQEGVPCQVRGRGTASTLGPFYATNFSWANPQGGIEVLVRREDVTTARQILGQGHPQRTRSSERWVEAFWIRALFMFWLACSAGMMVFVLSQNPYVGIVATFILFVAMLWLGRPLRTTP